MDLGYDIRTICDHVSAARSGSLRHSWQNVRDAIARSDELRKDVVMLMARIEEVYGRHVFTDTPTTDLVEAIQKVHRDLQEPK